MRDIQRKGDYPMIHTRLTNLVRAQAARVSSLSPGVRLYLAVLALTALGLGFSNDIISNYFKDAYRVTPYQRGLIEFPRELPGMICALVVAALGAFGDVRIAVIAHAFSVAGIFVLGLSSPPFAIMLALIFVNSLGQHLFMPVQDSIGIALARRESLGKRMGQFKGVTTGFQMLAAVFVFAGFRLGLFSFTDRVKWPFVIAAALILAALVALVALERRVGPAAGSAARPRFVFRKEYRFYYTLVVMFGVQKQIMLVYGPWVLIDLLGKKADTLALLGIVGAFLGIFFIPAVGRWLDRFGIRAMLYADALSFIGVYALYGLVSGGYASGALATVGWPVLLAYVVFVFDRMSTQMSLVRTVYLRTIAVDPADVTATLSLGISMDHVVSILCAYAGGIVWTLWGPQYVFYLAAALSFVNLYVAVRAPIPGR